MTPGRTLCVVFNTCVGWHMVGYLILLRTMCCLVWVNLEQNGDLDAMIEKQRIWIMRRSRVAILILTIAAFASVAVFGATPVASFGMQDSLVDSMGSGLLMTGISYVNGLSGQGFVPSNYLSETVFGESDKTYLSLAGREGLNLDISSLPDKSSYTIVIDVRTSQVLAYNKLISLDGGASDNGLYFFGGKLVF